MWQVVWDYFKTELSAYFVLGAAVIFILKLIANSAVNTAFNKNLEKHKSELMKVNDKYRKELNSEIEKLKHQQQRVFKDFELYTSKKHEKYPELFKSLETAFGFIYALRGHRRVLTFENTNKNDIEWYLESRKYTRNDTERVLSLWDGTKEAAIEEIKKRDRQIDYNEAEVKWHDVNDLFIYSELFCSDEVSKQFRKLLNLLWDYFLLLEPQIPLDASDIREQTQRRDELLPSEKEKLKQLMKKELTLSFSQDTINE